MTIRSAERAPATVRFVGQLDELTLEVRRALCERGSRDTANDVQAATAGIIAHVRREGDAALKDMARRFDRVDLVDLEVPLAACDRALDLLDADLRRAMERAARNIEAVHRAMAPSAVETEPERGVRIGRRPDPLARVGVYAPGGRATYPSSVMMGAIPARVAGVGEVILCSPPDADGLPSRYVLAAAALARVDRVFAVGGAGAIAAMALGTQSIPRVDRVVGPGNAYVAEAKRQLSVEVLIDSPAGPSELMILCDHHADIDAVALELLAQAEHDPDAAVLAVVVGSDGATKRFMNDVNAALARRVAVAPRAEVMRGALAAHGGLLATESLESAIAFASEWAPEHLSVIFESASESRAIAERVRNAGTIFIGGSSSVAFGDYMSGANHVLPTSGSARAYSGLSTLDFVRWTTWQEIDDTAAASFAEEVGVFADAEGLPGHAAAARRFARNSETKATGQRMSGQS